MAPEQCEPASTQYNDWRGTAALDDPHDGPAEIAEYARVPQGWDIVAIELFGSGMLDASWASVLAVERKRVQAAGDVEALASANGGALPVTRFRVLESDAVGVLTAMKQWSIPRPPRMVSG